jgi:hypothetical protein
LICVICIIDDFSLTCWSYTAACSDHGSPARWPDRFARPSLVLPRANR